MSSTRTRPRTGPSTRRASETVAASLTVWISRRRAQGAGTPPRRGQRKPGGHERSSNHAIETALTVGMVFHLGLRPTEGFLHSLFSLLDLDCQAPDHTTISRRVRKLGKVSIYPPAGKRPVHNLVDSTGLPIQVGTLRKPPKNRDWRKLHITVDAVTGQVIACDVTGKCARDTSRVPKLLKQINSPLASVRADGAYDSEAVYEAIESHTVGRSPRVLIGPKKNANVKPEVAALRERNRNIRLRSRFGTREWHTRSACSRRSMVANTMCRYKAIIGPTMKSRTLRGQRVEARVGCWILNTMAALGMPEAHRIDWT